MMMQKTRCESAATQGLRSDTIQANKMAASACEQLPHPSLPLACWLWTSPPKTSLAPKDLLKFSENIGFSPNNCWQVYCLHEESLVHWLLASYFQMAPLSHRLHIPLTSPSVWDKPAVECEPVWCCRCSAGGCWSAVALPGHWSGAQLTMSGLARRKVTQAALWCIEVTVSEPTHTARSRLLRLHYRGHYLHGISGIPGYEMRHIHIIWLQI